MCLTSMVLSAGGNQLASLTISSYGLEKREMNGEVNRGFLMTLMAMHIYQSRSRKDLDVFRCVYLFFV